MVVAELARVLASVSGPTPDFWRIPLRGAAVWRGGRRRAIGIRRVAGEGEQDRLVVFGFGKESLAAAFGSAAKEFEDSKAHEPFGGQGK
jgi:hypothetical protein